MKRKLVSEINEMREVVSYVDNRNAFVDLSTNKVLRGVSRACHKHYYPDFRLSKRVKKNNESQNSIKKAEKCKYAHIVGSLRGSIVDNEIQKIARRGKKNCNTEKMHPYTRKLLKSLEKIKLDIVDAQVPVFDLDTGIATAIDLICENKETNSLYLIEIKCGFNDNTYTDHNSQMKHELKDISNSPKHQHQVQASVTHKLFVNCYNSKSSYSSVETIIARVTDSGTHFEPLRSWVKPFVRKIIERISK